LNWPSRGMKKRNRDEEKELIMKTKAKDIGLFHKLVCNNRKKGNEVIIDLNVNGKQYDGPLYIS
jgi:hypothetical protein